MNSKYLGKEYEGFVVTKAYLRDDHKKQYGKDVLRFFLWFHQQEC